MDTAFQVIVSGSVLYGAVYVLHHNASAWREMMPDRLIQARRGREAQRQADVQARRTELVHYAELAKDESARAGDPIGFYHCNRAAENLKERLAA